MPDIEDFQEIDNCGGKFTIKVQDEDGTRSVSCGYSNSGVRAASIYGIYALTPQGIPVGTFFIGGINQGFSPPSPHESCIAIFMPSDRFGYFGRVCPTCKKYFRTESPSLYKPVTCAYCGLVALTHNFLTEGHRHFVKAHVDAFVEACETGKNVEIDLDEVARITSPNRPPHYFVEEIQQTRFKCLECTVTSDIIGIFGYCPHCGHRNSLERLNSQLSQLEDRVTNSRYSLEQRQERDNEWREIVKQSVSYFEGFARDLLSSILNKTPLIPTRRSAIEKISFHNPIIASEKLMLYLGIDILHGISEKDKEFIKQRFLRRHIYEHNAGIVDQEYLDKSQDTSVKLGQIVREKSSNVTSLIKLVRQIAVNYDKEFHAIK